MRFAIVLLLGGCSQLLGIEELDGPSDASSPNDGDTGADGPSPALECEAQRVVHVVGGNAGLAWFTLEWPAPFVITSFTPTFAFDDPGNVKNVSTEASHPLFARLVGGRAIWEGVGRDPHPTAFVAGSNETHTAAPASIVTSSGFELVAAGAAIQSSLAPPLPMLAFERSTPYGPAPGAPPATLVADVDGAIEALAATGAVTQAVLNQLRPSAMQLARYHGPGAASTTIRLATNLAFTANAFRFGLIGSVMMPAFNDDPHGAFATAGLPTTRANELATVLDAFYTDLASASEPNCGRGGNFLPLADNVVLIVTGDTPKNSFDNGGWPDGTPGGANVMYVRSNGFMRTGWFGELRPGVRTNFDPNTGALDANASVAASTNAAVAGTLYAIARGDTTAVAQFTNAPFAGVIADSD